MLITWFLHNLYSYYMTITCYTNSFAMAWNLIQGLFVVGIQSQSAQCCSWESPLKAIQGMVVAFQFQGSEEHWNNDGMQSLAIHCLFKGRNQQTAKTHIEMWPDRSEVETHIVRIGHILELDLDKKEAFLLEEGDKMLGDPGVCHRCHCPRASLWQRRHICTCVFA
jgi:hypothetical protein